MNKNSLAVWQTSLADATTAPYRTLLLLTVIAGLALRLGAIYFAQGYHHFMVNDEVSALEYILAFLNGDGRTYYLAQPAFNHGQLPGPLWTLFGVALFKLGGNSAEGALYWMAIVNSVTVYFVYLLAKRFFQPGLALLTTAFYALAPWTVYYSYGLYNPVPLDLIGVLLFLSLWNTISRADSRQVFWVPLLCAMVPQFHMIGVFVIPAVLLVLYLSPVRLNRGWLVAGIVAGTLLYVPYLIGDMQHHWHNLKALAEGGEDSGYSASALKVITAPVTVLSSIPAGWTGDALDTIKQFGNQWFGHYLILTVIAVWTAIHGFIYLFSFLGRFGRYSMRHWRKPIHFQVHDPKLAFTGILIVVPLLLFLLTGHNFSTRYAIILFPLLFLLPGMFLQTLRKPAVTRYWVISLALIALFNLYLLGSYYAHQDQRLAGSDHFMPSFRKLEQIRTALQKNAGPDRTLQIVLSARLAKQLSPFDHKLVATIKQYVEMWQTYRRHPDVDNTPADYFVSLAGMNEESRARIVYRQDNIVIYR
jgi:hypothetical protein